MKRTKALKELRKVAKQMAHAALKDTLPDEEQAKLTGDEVLNALYHRDNRGYLVLSPLCFKYHYKKLKEVYDSKTSRVFSS